ncbi:YdcF family protein [Methylophaga sp. OBS4]|nr:YdcF family protein [Methylophaga sp. OBS4]
MDNLFFVISKITWGFLSPSSLMIWLLLLTTLLLWLNYVRQTKRLLLLLSLAGFFMLAYPVSDWLMYPLETRFSQLEILPESIDGIVVLGGAEELKLSRSWNSAEVGQGAERILAAAKLAQHYPDVPIIYTGGSNLVQMQDLDKKGVISKALLIQAGVDESRLILESDSRNTFENFLRIKPVLPQADGRYLLVTSAFHMPRSVGVARQQQINVVPYPVDFRSNHPQYRYWDFDLFAHLQVLESAWHEWLGLSVYFLTGKTAEWLPADDQTAQ